MKRRRRRGGGEGGGIFVSLVKEESDKLHTLVNE